MAQVQLILSVLATFSMVSDCKILSNKVIYWDSSDELTNLLYQIDDIKDTDVTNVFQYVTDCLDDYILHLNNSNMPTDDYFESRSLFSSDAYSCIVNDEHKMYNVLKSLTESVNKCSNKRNSTKTAEDEPFSIENEYPDFHRSVQNFLDDAKQCNLQNTSNQDNLMTCIKDFVFTIQPILKEILRNIYDKIPSGDWECYSFKFYESRYKMSQLVEDLLSCFD